MMRLKIAINFLLSIYHVGKFSNEELQAVEIYKYWYNMCTYMYALVQGPIKVLGTPKVNHLKVNDLKKICISIFSTSRLI